VKALLMLGAIVSAWISGAGSSGNRRANRGAVMWLVVAIILGLIAWRWV
jgi:hypothetical protein